MSLLRGVAREDGGLNSSTIGNSLIMVDAIVGLLAIEEVGNKFDNTRNMSGTTDQDDFKHVQLVNRRVAKHLLNRFKGTSEEILAELFETSMSKGSVEINSLEKRVDVWVAEERVHLACSQLARRAEVTKSMGI